MNFFAVSYSKPALAQISNYVCFINIVHRSTSIQWLCLQQPWACPVTVVLALKIASNSNLFNGSMWKRWHLSGLSVHPSDFSCWNGPQLPPAPPPAFSWKGRLKCNDDFVVHALQVSKPNAWSMKWLKFDINFANRLYFKEKRPGYMDRA